MTKRYQVFVSSTYQDLTDERLEVIKALLELDCIPCGMEYFPAASEESWIYIASLIEQCDYYIVIVGGRYGSITPEGISFTQKEYEYALSKNIPSIAFLHANPSELPAKKTETDSEGRTKLSNFITLLKKHLCKEWSSTHELGAVVSRSLTQLIKRHPRVGWIPANQVSDPQATQELLELTKQVRRLEDELKRTKHRKYIEIEDLSDGDESVSLSFTYKVLRENTKSNYPRYIEARSIVDSISVSWNDIFRTIAPKMIPTASDQGIRRWISGMIDERHVVASGQLKANEHAGTSSLSTDSFHVVKIQLTALGLVSVGKDKNEDGSISSLLWHLTEKGEERMYQTLAIRR